MPEIYSKALDQTLQVTRIIGRVDGPNPGPCLLFFGGIHGNEPAGVFALHQVIQELEKRGPMLCGSFIAVSGNLSALKQSVRFHKTDLNRMWSAKEITALENGNQNPAIEDEQEQHEIFHLLHHLLRTETGPFYFFDLHTTSSTTIPFITVNDSLLNRRFTRQYPVPLVLGIEEYLDGPLLSYINDLGYISFGFEGGQHDEQSSIVNHKIFIYLSLVFTGALEKEKIPYSKYLEHWRSVMPNHSTFYEIYSQFKVRENEPFVMQPGFTNFQTVDRNQHLATSNGQTVYTKRKTIIFMPLYQSQGEDGYFLIRKIPPIFLWLSRMLRSYRLDRVFVLLPGIKWSSELKDTMIVDLRIARFISKQLFHLFGYRSKRIGKNHLLILNREYRSRTHEYKRENWFRS